MKRYLVGGIVVLVLLAAVVNFDKLLLGVMRLVDWYGITTGTCVVEMIDNLNTVYYWFYE